MSEVLRTRQDCKPPPKFVNYEVPTAPSFVNSSWFADKSWMQQHSKTHLDPFLFLSRWWRGGIRGMSAFNRPLMRFSMDKAGRDDAGMMPMPLKSPSATNKGTIFCQNGIFQLSGRCSLCSQPKDFDLAAMHGFKKVLYC